MCRSIKTLRVHGATTTEAEIRAAALQYVRKVSGFRTPSQANAAAFERAVAEISAITAALLSALPPARPSRPVAVPPQSETGA
ncbi:MAG: DUF2277 domain-containing protein [Thermoflexales bacterium]|jgi:hypothetical protein|nr:DUF2277 domain-containing protein [Thermoflexales bacterium]